MPFQHPEQICPICDHPFVPRREGAIVCSKKCGNRKNNLKKRNKQQQIYYRTRQTEENRKTLAHLYENPVLRLSVERDVLKGFNYHFGVCTHLDENPTSGALFFGYTTTAWSLPTPTGVATAFTTIKPPSYD